MQNPFQEAMPCAPGVLEQYTACCSSEHCFSPTLTASLQTAPGRTGPSSSVQSHLQGHTHIIMGSPTGCTTASTVHYHTSYCRTITLLRSDSDASYTRAVPVRSDAPPRAGHESRDGSVCIEWKCLALSCVNEVQGAGQYLGPRWSCSRWPAANQGWFQRGQCAGLGPPEVPARSAGWPGLCHSACCRSAVGAGGMTPPRAHLGCCR